MVLRYISYTSSHFEGVPLHCQEMCVYAHCVCVCVCVLWAHARIVCVCMCVHCYLGISNE